MQMLKQHKQHSKSIKAEIYKLKMEWNVRHIVKAAEVNRCLSTKFAHDRTLVAWQALQHLIG